MAEKVYTLITGATGGLGTAFALKMAKLNNNLFLTGRNVEKLELLKSKLQAVSPEISIETYACDLQSELSRSQMFSYIKNKDIFFDMLINVAGVDTQKAFEKYSQEKIIFQSRVIFEATVCITHFALMQNLGSLKVITVSSICGITPMPYFAIYSALKGALTSFFDAIRREYRNNKNFVFTTILPGSIPTREDIIKDIEKQGLQGKLSQKPPEYIVEKSLLALKKRKGNYIPGGYNAFIAFIQKLTFKSIKMSVVEKKFKNKEKDAF